MLEPLIFNKINVPFWIRLIPFRKYSYMKKKINRVLFSRSDDDFMKAWKDNSVSIDKVKGLLNIVAKYCDWKSNKFIPMDECLCVFLDHDLELGTAVALVEIEENYPNVDFEQFNEYITSNSKLVDIICIICKEQ